MYATVNIEHNQVYVLFFVAARFIYVYYIWFVDNKIKQLGK